MPSHRNAGSRPPLTRSTRSWTDPDGIHYLVNTFSGNSGLSFGTMTGSSGEHFARNASTSAAPRRSSMFGNAFSMLEDIVALQQQHRAAVESSTAHQFRSPRTQNFRVNIDSDTDGDDDPLAYGQPEHRRRKSVFSRIKERLLDGKRSPKRDDASSSSREESPERNPREGRRGMNHRAETRDQAQSRQSRRPFHVDIVVEHEEDDSANGDSEAADSDPHSRVPSAMHHTDFEDLENNVEHERRAVRACKRRLEQASRQSNVSSAFLQQVVDEMKSHENALASATDRLRKAKERPRVRMPQAQARPRPQTYHPRNPEQRPSGASLEGRFFPAFAGFEFDQPTQYNQHRNPMLDVYEQLNSFNHFSRPQSFGDFGRHFEHNFGHMPPSMAAGAHIHFFDTPGTQPRSSQRKRTRFSEGPPPADRQSHHVPEFSPPPSPPSPQPPPSLLNPAEAQRLFKHYNDRWNSLLPTDPAIPYPARGLLASSLSARDTIWAPHLKEDISTWSEETVMQANAQAFYLGVVGLLPRYSVTSGTGQIQCGIEKASASPGQIKQLVDILKKEKPRWHSDRLGRRNGGVVGGGPNETLQKDVRARAVFHAVCELMDRASE